MISWLKDFWRRHMLRQDMDGLPEFDSDAVRGISSKIEIEDEDDHWPSFRKLSSKEQAMNTLSIVFSKTGEPAFQYR